VSLTIDQSELAAIVGPPGAGKTTLLHLMATR
jgi:ABC-type multidrug transport system ATPase subunit